LQNVQEPVLSELIARWDEGGLRLRLLATYSTCFTLDHS